MNTPSLLRKDPDIYRAVIAEYANTRRKVKDIAADYGIARETVTHWARRAGVSRRGKEYHGRCRSCASRQAQASGFCPSCEHDIVLSDGRWVLDPVKRIQVWEWAS